MKELKTLFNHYFRFGNDSASEDEIIEGIKQGIEFRGAKLWILVLAIFVASLGLNTNSAAVIIGAMLISPLMGPIIGMGLGAGIYDFQLLHRSWHNYIVATLFSIATATLYFLITPIAEAQSELMARTSPTIYDVLIALCGGLAGIIALSSRSQRTGNVIPGVAIATALMPPLCTVGFGIATANWQYALGALYLFVINTIFIATATFIGAVFIMKFHKTTFINKNQEKKVKAAIVCIALLTVVPSVILTFGMVRESYFEQHVNSFISKELHFPSTRVMAHHTHYKEKSFDIVLIGAEVDSIAIQEAKKKMSYYGLDGVKMDVLQGSASIKTEEFMNKINASNITLADNEAFIAQQQAQISDLEQRLQPYENNAALSHTLIKELQTLYPQISEISISRGSASNSERDSIVNIAVISLTSPLPKNDGPKLHDWLNQRTGLNLKVLFE